MDTRDVFGPDHGPGERRPNVGELWLHRPTGAAGVCFVMGHHDGGPIIARNEQVLEPLTPVPLPAGYPDAAGRTEEQVAAAASERGWRPVTRVQAAALLRLEGYRLGTERAYGHALYADQADAVTWHDHPSTRHSCQTLAARDGLEQGTPTPSAAAPSRLALATLVGENGRVLLAPLTARRDGSLYLHTGAVLDPHSPPLQPSVADAQRALAEVGWFPVPHARAADLLGFSEADDEALQLLHAHPACQETWHRSADDHYLNAVVAYRGTSELTTTRRPDLRLGGGYLTDDLLARIGVEPDVEFEEPFEDATLRWLAETVNDAARIALHPHGQWDDPDEHFARPYAPLGAANVAMLADALSDDPRLVLTWTTAAGVRLASADIHPEDLLGEEGADGCLTGYALARHAVAAAYGVIERTTEASLASDARSTP